MGRMKSSKNGYDIDTTDESLCDYMIGISNSLAELFPVINQLAWSPDPPQYSPRAPSHGTRHSAYLSSVGGQLPQ